MTTVQEGVGVRRVGGDDLIVYTQRRIEISDGKGLGGEGRFVRKIPWIDLQQQLRLRAGLRELVPLVQHPHVIVSRGHMGRIEEQAALQQEFRVVQHAELQPDGRQQAHPLRVPGVLAHVFAACLIRTLELAVMQIDGDRQQRRRQFPEHGGALRRPLGKPRFPPRLMERGELPPAVEQRRIEAGRLAERGDGIRHRAGFEVEIPELPVRRCARRRGRDEAAQEAQRGLAPIRPPVAAGEIQQDILLLRILRELFFQVPYRRGKPGRRSVHRRRRLGVRPVGHASSMRARPIRVDTRC